MKPFLTVLISSFTFLTSCSLIGSTRTAMIDTPAIPDIFESVCIGRYQMDMPKGTQLTDGTFRSHFLKTRFTKPIRGINRQDIWLRGIEEKRKSDAEFGAKYIHQTSDQSTLLRAIHLLFRSSEDDLDPTHMVDIFLYQDFPQLKLALDFEATSSKTNFTQSKHRNYLPLLERFIKPLPSIAQHYKHQPWPHNQLGVCLTKDITFNTPKAAEDEYLRVIYRFREKTFFQFYIRAYAKDQYAVLQEQISRKLGALSLFASDYFNFGGRTGKLFLSGDVYSPTATRFRWYATDASAGSTRKPYISIEGRVDINDFPELKGLNNIDSNAIALSLLASFQPRENGLLGTR